MILSTIRMKVLSGKRREALRILKLAARYTRVQPGCLESRIYEDAEDFDMLMIMERWRNIEELTRHLQSEEYRNILLVMEMASRAPEVRFDTVSTSSGMETVERARNRH